MSDYFYFRNLSHSLYIFISRLALVLHNNNISDVFFLSREGYFLKQMFDIYAQEHFSSSLLKTHYLKVSRRSTFLLSLGDISNESFTVLFRQYRNISANDFLDSLTLRDISEQLAIELDVSPIDFNHVTQDFPTSRFFTLLLHSELFRHCYESKRIANSNAFASYLSSYYNNTSLPQSLYLVDVGWKGSIQDNLHSWIIQSDTTLRNITGYYIGLQASAQTSATNKKHGLIFSDTKSAGLSYGYHVFNEFKTIYEIILHSDHGAVREYKLNAQHTCDVIEDNYIEREMISLNVQAKSNFIFNDFVRLVKSHSKVNVISSFSTIRMILKHASMVFAPSAHEAAWVESLTHREHFGVFNNSTLGSSSYNKSFTERFIFSMHVVRYKSLPISSFWPTLTLRQNALPGLSILYALYRLWSLLKVS